MARFNRNPGEHIAGQYGLAITRLLRFEDLGARHGNDSDAPACLGEASSGLDCQGHLGAGRNDNGIEVVLLAHQYIATAMNALYLLCSADLMGQGLAGENHGRGALIAK